MCELSPSASTFSTMLSAFIGSVLNGLFSGFWIAFFTGWISWLACIRIVAAGLYEAYLTFKAGTKLDDADAGEYHTIGMVGLNQTVGDMVENQGENLAGNTQGSTGFKTAFAQQRKTMKRLMKTPDGSVTFFGWLGWIWSGVYTPVSQSIWIAANISTGKGVLLFVRALAISVSALGLTFDYKQRYAASLGRKWGSWAFVLFNTWNAAACLLLGVESIALLIIGATRFEHLPIPLVVVYPLFSIVWAVGSWAFLPPIDASRPGINIVADIAMGAFAGVFCAAPSFALWQNARFDAQTSEMFGHGSESGLSLNEFLACESAGVLQKFAAIMP